MSDDLTAQLAAVQRAMAAPLPTPAELAAWAAEDKATAQRIHQVRPGVPVHHAYAVLESLRVVQRVDAAKAVPSCRWPACLSEAEQQQLADDAGREMLGEPTVPGPDQQAACGCDGGEPELTREELQGLVDEQGQDLYQARDLLDFIREMCDLNDAGGTPITTTDVRGWLRYTGCGGVLVLPDEVVASLATMSGTGPDKAATSGDAPDIAGEPEPDDGSGFRCPYCSGPTTYQAFSGGREWCCETCEETGEYPADQTPVRAALLRTEDGRTELRRQMREHLDGLRKGEQP